MAGTVKFTTRDCLFIGLGVVATGTLVYCAYQRDQGNQPRYDSEATVSGLNAIMTVFDHLNTGDHYFHPGYVVSDQQQIFTPHRYPTVSGGNITALIHQGFSGMSQPAPQDDDWLIEPPGREMFLCQKPCRKVRLQVVRGPMSSRGKLVPCPYGGGWG